MSKQEKSLRIKIRNISNNPSIAPYVFISPFFILFFIFMIYPIIHSLFLSLFTFKGIQNRIFTGLGNYINLFKDDRFLHALYNTTYFAFSMILLSLLLSFPLSLLLNTRKFPGRNFFRLVLFIPILTSLIVAGAVFKLIFLDSDAGLLNSIVKFLGGKSINWLLNDFWAINCIVFMAFWRRLGLNMMYFIAGLQSLPEDLYESAVIDGANSFQKLRYITLPLMKPILSFVLIITLIYAYLAFDEVFVLSPAGAMDSAQNNMVTLGYYLYESGFQLFKFGYGSAIGFIMTLLILLVSIIQLKMMGVLKSE